MGRVSRRRRRVSGNWAAPAATRASRLRLVPKAGVAPVPAGPVAIVGANNSGPATIEGGVTTVSAGPE